METQQTLDRYVKTRKRPTNDDCLSKKAFLINSVGKSKPSRKLSFDGSLQQISKKQKVCLP